MYIQKVKLQNFRSFGDEGICFLFNKGINAVIGENNNGKTALIDAIRIAFSCVLYKKDIFFSKTDFHVNAAGERAACTVRKNTNRDDGNKRNNQKCHKQTGAKFDSPQHIGGKLTRLLCI